MSLWVFVHPAAEAPHSEQATSRDGVIDLKCCVTDPV
jgi:hypothetical protein